jgi:hypothetical protein
MAVDAFAEKLGLLLSQGSLAASRFSSSDRRRLETLFDSGILIEKRRGAGRCVVLVSTEAFSTFIARAYPSGLEKIPEDLTPRTRAVMEARNSKKSRETGPLTVLLRGFGDAQMHAEGRALPVAQWTDMAGVAALRIGGKRNWRFFGNLAVVENIEVFWNIEKVAPFVEMALYAQGRLSQNIIDWLASPEMARTQIIHFGDYDPVGLDEYLRLKKARPLRTKLYMPEDIEDLIARYGNKALVSNSAAVLRRLRKAEDADVAKVVGMLDRHGAGLEQEILLSKKLKNGPE